MPKKHHIKLEPDERARLESILRKGIASTQAQRHARILLLADRFVELEVVENISYEAVRRTFKK